jgi:hypothetical protein
LLFMFMTASRLYPPPVAVTEGLGLLRHYRWAANAARIQILKRGSRLNNSPALRTTFDGRVLSRRILACGGQCCGFTGPVFPLASASL